MSACTSCGGTVEDGYCNVCGLAAAPAASPAAGPGSAPAGSGSAGSGTAGSRTSRRTAGTRSSRGSRRTSGRSARGRLGAGLVEIPPVPYRDPASAVLADPQVPESRRFCANCEQPVGRGRDGPGATGARAGVAEGFCRNCGTRFSFTPKLEPGDLVGGPVRGARVPRARRARLDLPGQGPQRERPLGGAQGPAQHRGRRRHGSGGRRAPVPRPGGAPEHRPDLQLRPARGPADRGVGRVHRDGVRGRQVAQADPARRPVGRRLGAGGTRPGLRDRGAARPRVPARPRAGVLRLQAGQRDPDRGAAQAHRHGRGAAGRRRGGRSTARSATRRPRSARTGRRCRPTCTRSARALAVLTFEFKGYQSTYKFTFPDRRAAARAAGVVRPAAAPGHRCRS